MTDPSAPVRLPALDPELAPIIESIPDFSLDAAGLPAIRELMSALRPDIDLERVRLREIVLDEDSGLCLRVLSPAAGGTGRPCVYAIHGGGYVLGDRAMDDDRLADWVDATGCVTVSVASTAWRPSTRTPPRSTTAAPACGGSTTTPRSSGSTPGASGSPA